MPVMTAMLLMVTAATHGVKRKSMLLAQAGVQLLLVILLNNCI